MEASPVVIAGADFQLRNSTTKYALTSVGIHSIIIISHLHRDLPARSMTTYFLVGNGPSGIALSFMLSGNLPFLISDSHPDDMLSMRLRSGINQCLVNQDLGHLAAGLEGRSTNPVSLLLDSLLHPCADIGMEMEPLVEFKKAGVEVSRTEGSGVNV